MIECNRIECKFHSWHYAWDGRDMGNICDEEECHFEPKEAPIEEKEESLKIGKIKFETTIRAV